MDALPRETRTHVRIDPTAGTASSGFLYSTISLRFPDGISRRPGAGPSEVAILVRVEPVGGENVPTSGFVPLGGERRLALVEPGAGLWPAPDRDVCRGLAEKRRLSLYLSTPAIFERGWLPGWLDNSLEGTPPGVAALRLRLVSAVVGRRVGVSGWDIATRSPKPARAAVPAGSVYFFEVVMPEALTEETVCSLWLRPMSDVEQDRRDGFGLAVPGTWMHALDTC
jgi:CRISPR-associated protein Cmr3